MSGIAWKYTLPSGVCSMTNLPSFSAAKGNDPLNQWIVSGSTGGVVTIFGARTGEIVVENRLHGDDVRSIVTMPPPTVVNYGFSGATKKQTNLLPFLVTTSFDGTAAMWSIKNKKFERLAVLQGAHTDKVLGCSVLPWSQQILTSGADGKIALWTAPDDY